MKTVVIDTATNVVVNVGSGEAMAPPPPGMRYEVVDDSVYVGPGFSWDGANWVPPGADADHAQDI